MNDNKFFAHCRKLLQNACTLQEYINLTKLFNYIDNTNGITEGHGIVCSCELIASAEWYYHASKMADVFAKNSRAIEKEHRFAVTFQRKQRAIIILVSQAVRI